MSRITRSAVVFAAICASLGGERALADDALLQRIEELESQTRALRAELNWSRERLERLPAATPDPVIEPVLGPVDDFEYMSLDELREEVAWHKGGIRIVPYGFLWGSATYATGRTTPGAYTLYVPSVDTEGEDTFVIDTRRTRIGANLTGQPIACLGCAKVGGKLEIDFHGSFAVENKPGVLLRHAYGEVYTDNWKMLAGQTWDVVSPLYPGTLNYSVGWGGGNVGYRRAQIRFERYFHLANYSKMTMQFSMNQNIVSDLSSEPGVQRESAGWPLLQGRMAYTSGGCLPWTVGVSGHIGNQGFDTTAASAIGAQDDIRLRTWSAHMDVRVPISSRGGIQGEAFMGDNLGTFLGGIVQGVQVDAGAGRLRGIRSRGGWIDAWFDWTDHLTTHVGYGVDDPINVDVIAMTGRTYNHFLFGNVTYEITPKMIVGVEVTSWRTHYVDPAWRPGDSVTFEFMGRYAF
jgi:hypothetical protein